MYIDLLGDYLPFKVVNLVLSSPFSLVFFTAKNGLYVVLLTIVWL